MNTHPTMRAKPWGRLIWAALAAGISLAAGASSCPPEGSPPPEEETTPSVDTTDPSASRPLVAFDQAVSGVPGTPITLELAAEDPDGIVSQFTFQLLSSARHGSIAGLPPLITYTAHANYASGLDEFTFQATSGGRTSNVARVVVTVGPPNQVPSAVPQSIRVPFNGSVPIQLVGTDPDSYPAALTYIIAAWPQKGALTGAPPNLAYTPPKGYLGLDGFTFKTHDGAADSNLARVTITVGQTNAQPLAQNSSFTVTYEGTRQFTLSAGDPDDYPQPLTYVITTHPVHGNIRGTPPALTYTAFSNYLGPDSVQFKVNDGVLDSNIGIVSIQIGSTNRAPVAQDANLSVPVNGSAEIVLIASDPDNYPEPLNYSISSAPAHGTLSGQPPRVTYTPAADFSGSDSFGFRAGDGVAQSNEGRVAIQVP